MEAFPALRATYSDAEIAEGLRNMTTTAGTGPAEDTGRQAEALRREIVEIAGHATNAWFRMRGIPYNGKDYGIRRKAIFNHMPMQAGDVAATAADTDDLFASVGFKPSTPLAEGIRRYVDWHRAYHKV